MTYLTMKGFNKTPPPIVPLNFTANTAGSTVKLAKTGNPTAVTLETSTDGENWSIYTFGTDITLTNIGDKVYFRNTSETDTGFSLGNADMYNFKFTGSISASGDVSTLLNKNGTDTVIGNWSFNQLFVSCSSLTSAPTISFTTLADGCFNYMFLGCSNLETLPSLKALTIPYFCCRGMFANCSKIKLSTSKTGEYVNEYRIPTSGTGTVGTNALLQMFSGTGGTFTSDPSINTTYYTSNTLVG